MDSYGFLARANLVIYDIQIVRHLDCSSNLRFRSVSSSSWGKAAVG